MNEPEPNTDPRQAAVQAEGLGTPSLRSRAINASIWTFVGMGASRVLRLGGNLILTRMLFPEAFGLMALVFVFTQGMEMMSDLGIGPSVVQNQRGDDREFLDTAWTLQILRGLGIWVGIGIVSWPAALFYGEPQLAMLLPVVGFTAVLSGCNSMARHTVARHLALGRLAVFDLLAQVFAIGVMVVWALLTPTVWALVAGAVAGATARMVLSHFLLPATRSRLRWDASSAWAVIHFGKWIFLTSAVGFLAAQVDRLILGKLISFEALGIYSIALMISTVPNDLVASLGMKVIFPAASRRADLPRPELRDLVLRNRWPLLGGLALATTLLAVFGDLLIHFLYDVRYHEAGWMLSLLAFGLWPRVLTNTMGPALLAIGDPRFIAYSASVRFVLLCVGIPLAHHFFGLPGVVVAVALGSIPDYAVEAIGLWQHGLSPFRQDMRATLLWAALAAGLWSLRSMLGLGNPF